MKRLTGFAVVLICISIFTSTGFAWTDDVEGMLMPTARGEGSTTDADAAMESVEPTEGESSEEAASEIKWE